MAEIELLSITQSTFMMIFMTGSELQDAIRRLGCSQKGFAEHCQMQEAHLSKLCRGHRPVPYWLVLVLTEWLGPLPVNRPPRATRAYGRRLRNPQDGA